jgi:hypothetical protein
MTEQDTNLCINQRTFTPTAERATVLTVNLASCVRLGDMLRPEGSQEIMLVTSRDGDVLTVARGYGGSNVVPLRDGMGLFVLGNKKPDPPKQLLVYIAGPYRSPTEYGLVENIRNAEHLALLAWKDGHAVICPHKNTAHFGGALALPDEVWLRGDMTMLRRCDAVVLCPGWTRSAGTLAEIALARELGIPLYEGVDGLKELKASAANIIESQKGRGA